MVLMVLSAFIGVLTVAIIAVLFFWSWPGRPAPFLDERGHPLPDSISEKIRVNINGFEQGMFPTAQDAIDLAAQVPAVDVPVYFLHGLHDYTCTYAEASIYFDRLTAPLKGFYTFRESAHSPVFEEPDKVMAIVREDVLNGTNRLAD